MNASLPYDIDIDYFRQCKMCDICERSWSDVHAMGK